MDGRSRPYFCGVDQTLNFQQKEALAQGILRVVETIPEGFETFEFQFTGHQVHIYRLDHGMVLLVLTRSSLIYSDYLEMIKNLKAVLKEDISNAIATFRLIAGNITLSGTGSDKGIVTTTSSSGSKATDTGRNQPETGSQSTSVPASGKSPGPSLASEGFTTSTPTISGNPSLKELLPVLNHLSKFTTQYLGTHVIVNYWKTSRPDHDWLANFQIDRTGNFTFTAANSQEQPLNPEETKWVREWVRAFIKRCSQVIRDFPNLVEQKALSEEQKKLLLG